MNSEPKTIDDLIRRRRSIKPGQMSDREIDSETLMTILEHANWAPTHGLTEPWRFSIFRGNARKALGEFLSETYAKVTSEEDFKPSKFEKLRVNPTLAPVVIGLGMKRQASGKIPEIEEVEAVACAVQNMHLSATAHGLGGFWSSNAAACSDAMRGYMGLNEGDRALGLFYLGYPNIAWPSGSRTSIEQKLKWFD